MHGTVRGGVGSGCYKKIYIAIIPKMYEEYCKCRRHNLILKIVPVCLSKIVADVCTIKFFLTELNLCDKMFNHFPLFDETLRGQRALQQSPQSNTAKSANICITVCMYFLTLYVLYGMRGVGIQDDQKC